MNRKVGTKRIAQICVAVIAAFAFLLLIRSKFYVHGDRLDFNTGNSAVYISAMQTVEQQFTLTDEILEMELLADNRGSETAVLTAVITDIATNEEVATVYADLPPTEEGEYISFSFPAMQISETIDAMVSVTAASNEEDAIFIGIDESDESCGLVINGEPVEGQLRMSIVYSTVHFMMSQYIAFAVVVLAGLFLFFMPKRIRKVENYVLILGLAGGLAFAFINAPLQECDAMAHLYRAMDASYGNIVASFYTLGHSYGYVTQPENLSCIGYTIIQPGSGMGCSYIENLKNLTLSAETVLKEYSGDVTAFYYWPQALGLALGRLMGGNAYLSFILARVLNLFSYLALAYTAVKKMPIYRNIFAAITVMPLALHQAASFSQDSLLNGLCFLFIALCFYYAYDEKISLGWKNAILLAILLCVIFLCKYVYICLGLLVFIIPVKRFGNREKYLKNLTIAIAVILLYILIYFICMKLKSVPGSTADETASVGPTQLQMILANPLAYLRAFAGTIFDNCQTLINELNIMGSLVYKIPLLSTFVPLFFAAVGFVDSNELSNRMPVKDKALSLAALISVIFATFLALYVGDLVNNPVGATEIHGVQGRYFISVLILVFTGLGSRKLENKMSGLTEKTMFIMWLCLILALFAMFRMCYAA